MAKPMQGLFKCGRCGLPSNGAYPANSDGFALCRWCRKETIFGKCANCGGIKQVHPVKIGETETVQVCDYCVTSALNV